MAPPGSPNNNRTHHHHDLEEEESAGERSPLVATKDPQRYHHHHHNPASASTSSCATRSHHWKDASPLRLSWRGIWFRLALLALLLSLATLLLGPRSLFSSRYRQRDNDNQSNNDNIQSRDNNSLFPFSSPLPPVRIPTVSPTRPCPPRASSSWTNDEPYIGNATRPDFGARQDEYLVLCETFDNDNHDWQRLWQADRTLFGEGNGGFAYYTPDNVQVRQDGALHLWPDLLTNLGTLETVAGTYDAAAVMVGNCTPFPDCATLDLTTTKKHCTIAAFDGCRRIGTPLVTLNPVTSGRVSTKDRFSLLYGRLEARVRLPQGDWLWPALWLMPANESDYGTGWPDAGEFDILESKGNDPRVYGTHGGGRNVFSSCLHYHGNSWWKTFNSLQAHDIIPACRNGSVPRHECDWSTDFFTIGLYWSPSLIYVYALREDKNDHGELIQEEIRLFQVDASGGFGPNDYPLGINHPPFFENETRYNDANDESSEGPYAKSPNPDAPFDKPFYLILNLAVGGDLDGCPNPGYWGPDALWCTQRDVQHPEVASRTVFWNHKDMWYPSWQQAKANHRDSFAIDSIKIWQ